MSALLIAVSMGGAAAAGITGFVGYRLRQKNKNFRYRQSQIQSRIDKTEQKKAQAVRELQLALRGKLSELAFRNGGQGAEYVAQRVAEDVFYEWLNHNFGLFHCAMADSHIRITGVKNGHFQYELPEQLKQYKG